MRKLQAVYELVQQQDSAMYSKDHLYSVPDNITTTLHPTFLQQKLLWPFLTFTFYTLYGMINMHTFVQLCYHIILYLPLTVIMSNVHKQPKMCVIFLPVLYTHSLLEWFFQASILNQSSTQYKIDKSWVWRDVDKEVLHRLSGRCCHDNNMLEHLY